MTSCHATLASPVVDVTYTASLSPSSSLSSSARQAGRTRGACSSGRLLLCLLSLLLALCTVGAARSYPFTSLPSSDVWPRGLGLSTAFSTPLRHAWRKHEEASRNALGQTASAAFMPKNIPTQPPCGMDACDEPAAVDHWLELVAERMRRRASEPPLTLRARVFLLTDDDGSNPVVSLADIDDQFRVINATLGEQLHWAFSYEVMPMRSSIVRARVIVPFCTADDIGTGSCTGMKAAYCNMTVTGWAGGDCIDVPAAECATLSGDGICQPECNFARYEYDGGDCCLPEVAVSSCREPHNPLRAWIAQDDFRAMPLQFGYEIDAQHFSIYIADYAPAAECTLCGASTTCAWDYNISNVLSQGSVYSSDTFRGSSSLFGGGSVPLHELGHTLGLLHTFRGLEMLMFSPTLSMCDLAQTDTCVDVVQYDSPTAGALTGDCVNDTRVTPLIFNVDQQCGAQPDGTDCNNVTWMDTPSQNFMGFNYFSCSPSQLSFTTSQVAKMHCNLAQHYSDWIVPVTPAKHKDGSNKLSTLAVAMVSAAGGVLFLCVSVAVWRWRRRRASAQHAGLSTNGYLLQQ